MVNDRELITLIQQKNLIDPVELKTLLGSINANKGRANGDSNAMPLDEANNLDDDEFDEDPGQLNGLVIHDNGEDDEVDDEQDELSNYENTESYFHNNQQFDEEMEGGSGNDDFSDDLNKIDQELEMELANEMNQLVNENNIINNNSNNCIKNSISNHNNLNGNDQYEEVGLHISNDDEDDYL